ncbi:MAG: hypothetical protein JW932_19030 [Deltaproteobacteria bacterium]|nr:hypothetical protein [Deltaproteobacteria bacterium]
MCIQSLQKLKRLLICLILVAIGLPIFLAFAGNGHNNAESGHKIFIAFGFHVNLYHSFRNDTNDDSGIGKDIRVIRHIIRTLDRYNADGIPVKGVWDFDNLFSLQEVLPRYAPDIIEDIRRRIHEHGDEVILMSYNNGLVSAMTEDELDDAVQWSITNPWQSGVQDLFGRYTPIVRPQEMMTTPGNFSIYKKHGIQAVTLYYSATPFDAFRVFSRPLSLAEAHNPILYSHPKTKEQMIVIPTYHFGDLVEHVSLRHWVTELRDMQDNGRLNQDALIFINYDADSELWAGIDLPWIMEWLPNTGGVGALIREIQDIPYAQFTRLGDYLADHPPVGSPFYFSQDTADGSFNGYNSWAEKAEASRYWTTIERSRRTHVAALKAMNLLNDFIHLEQLTNVMNFADMTRLRALSTTHFGMATPFLARQREGVIANLMSDLDGYSDRIEQLVADGVHAYLKDRFPPSDVNNGLNHLTTMMVMQTYTEKYLHGHRFLKIVPPEGYQEGMRLLLTRSDGSMIPFLDLGIQEEKSSPPMLMLYIPGDELITDGVYDLFSVPEQEVYPRAFHGFLDGGRSVISNGRIAIHLGQGEIEGIYLDGVRQTNAGSLLPYFKWNDRAFQARGAVQPEHPTAEGQPVHIRLAGPFPGPIGRTLSEGWMDYRFSLMPGLPYVMIQGKIKYPTTQADDILKAATPGLIRRADMGWQEAAPAEIRFFPSTSKKEPVRVLKHNYLGVSTEYTLDYFQYGDWNLDLDNINNHITESYVGLVVGDSGMAIAMDTSVQCNFAFSPMKMRHDKSSNTFNMSINPFGTYHGRQYKPPTQGNGNGFDITLLAGEQFAGAGPTYNGVEQEFSLLLAFFKGQQMPESIRLDLTDFAHPPMIISEARSHEDHPIKLPMKPPQGLVAAYRQGSIQFSWDNDQDPEGHYRIYCGSQTGCYHTTYPAVGNSLMMSCNGNGQPFVLGKRYVATIEKVSANGQTSERAPEIQFTVGEVEEKQPGVPFGLELKVLWASFQSILTSF